MKGIRPILSDELSSYILKPTTWCHGCTECTLHIECAMYSILQQSQGPIFSVAVCYLQWLIMDRTSVSHPNCPPIKTAAIPGGILFSRIRQCDNSWLDSSARLESHLWETEQKLTGMVILISIVRPRPSQHLVDFASRDRTRSRSSKDNCVQLYGVDDEGWSSVCIRTARPQLHVGYGVLD